MARGKRPIRLYLEDVRHDATKAQLRAALDVLATQPDPGLIYDLVESWVVDYPDIPILFADRFTPLNVLVVWARSDLRGFFRLFWRMLAPELVEEYGVDKAVMRKADRRVYQRGYMRNYRHIQQTNAPVSFGGGELQQLEAVLSQMDDEDSALVPKE